jgi:ATP-dependent DNA ligase
MSGLPERSPLIRFGQGQGCIAAADACRSAFHKTLLPSPADRPPSGTFWIHEIKHDGYRLMARRDSVG